MKKLGHIEIGKELRFVYYELEKPKEEDYSDYIAIDWDGDDIFRLEDTEYYTDLKEYEASKRSVKVSNVSNLCKDDIVKNPFCEAEITDGKAVITKIT